MKLFLAFVINLILSLGTSILLYKLFKVDISPVTFSLAIITVYMFLPQRFHDWIAKK
jgi:hypothetical protein